MNYRRTSRQKLIDALYVGILLCYALAGMMLTPFHGDEATIIYMSRDWYRITHDHDLSLILYRPTIEDDRERDMQEYRLQNGVVSKYAIGLVASLIGLQFNDVNDPWYWGADFENNRANGHIPNPTMFFAARLSSTFMLMMSIAIVFAIARTLGKSLALSPGQGRTLSYITTFIYVTLPAVLLNGRRAMFEGADLLALSLVIWVGLRIAYKMQTSQPGWQLWLGFGLTCGFGIASKHSVLITIVSVYAALGLIGLMNLRHLLRPAIIGFILSGLTAVVLFLVLNPAWWNQPLKMPALAAQIRQKTLTAQITYMGGYTRRADRVLAITRFPLSEPQYFEGNAEDTWGVWIKSQIDTYSPSGLSGIDWHKLPLLIYPLLAVGMLSLAISGLRKQYAAFTLLMIIGLTAFALLVVIPVPWQRYYLPLALPWSVGIALGVVWLWSFSYSRLAATAQSQATTL